MKSINNITCCNNGTDINSSNQSNDVAEGKMLQKSPNPSVSISENIISCCSKGIGIAVWSKFWKKNWAV